MQSEAVASVPPARDGEPESLGSVCVDANELFDQRARAVIRRVLGDWLTRMSITPIELLHHPEYLTQLDNAGSVLQAAVQRVGRSHAHSTGESLHSRMRHLYDLTDAVVVRVRKDAQAKRFPALADVDVDGLARKLGDGPDAEYLFNAAMAARLGTVGSLTEKLQLLLRLLDTAQDSVPYLDQLIAEFLDDTTAMTELLGEQPSLGSAVLQLAALAQGRFVEQATPQPGYERMADLILKRRMPACRATIARRIIRTLEGRQPLVDGNVYSEVRFNAELGPLLKDSDGGFLGGSAMQQALRARLVRHLQPSKLATVLADAESPMDQIERLLEMEEGLLDDDSREDFAKFLLQVIGSTDKDYLRDESEKTGVLRLQRLADLQQRVFRTRLPRGLRQRIGERLDGFSVEILKRTKIAKPAKLGDTDYAKRVLMLLNLCANGALTEGDASSIVRRQVTAYAKSPGFLEGFVEAAGGGSVGKQRLMLLHRLLTAVGLAGPQL